VTQPQGMSDLDGSKAGDIPWDQVWDSVVVGAGPAGAMTALELGRAKKRVLLIDRGAFPRWKVCGATLSPGVKDLLVDAGLGGLLSTLGASALHRLRLGGWSMQADLPLNGSISISRYALDAALIREARRSGVYFCPEARGRLGPVSSDRRFLEVTAGGAQIEVQTRAVVAADGLGSRLMAQAGVPSEVPATSRRRLVGLGGVFSPSPSSYPAGVIHMAVGEAGYVGLSRVEDGSLNVAAALDPTILREKGSPGELVQSLLSECGWPGLPDTPSEGWKGTPELTRRPRQPGAERLFAVGDAGGYVEPFTGEGGLLGSDGRPSFGTVHRKSCGVLGSGPSGGLEQSPRWIGGSGSTPLQDDLLGLGTTLRQSRSHSFGKGSSRFGRSPDPSGRGTHRFISLIRTSWDSAWLGWGRPSPSIRYLNPMLPRLGCP